MSLYKRQGSKYWYIALMHQRRRIQFSTKTTDRHIAKQIELAFLIRLKSGNRERFMRMMEVLVGDDKPGELGERALIKRMPETIVELMRDEHTAIVPRSQRDRVLKCNRFAQWCAQQAGAVFLDDVTPDVAWRFVSSLKGKAQTKQNVVGVLSASWGCFIRRGLATDNPWMNVRPETVPEEVRTGRAFSSHEVAAIVREAEAFPWLKTAIMIAVYTGLRKGDVLALRWEAVDFDGKVINLTPSKTARFKRRITIPLCQTLEAYLKTLPRDAETIIPASPRPTTAANQWKKCLANAGVVQRGEELMTFHNLRHTFATWIRNAGADKGEQMMLGGWTTLAVSNRYDHATERLREVVEAMPSV